MHASVLIALTVAIVLSRHERDEARQAARRVRASTGRARASIAVASPYLDEARGRQRRVRQRLDRIRRAVDVLRDRERDLR